MRRKRIEVWFIGSRPQASALTAMPGQVCVWITQSSSGFAWWMAPWMTKPARLMP